MKAIGPANAVHPLSMAWETRLPSPAAESERLDVPKQLHHVVMRSHSAATFVNFLTDVVGMEVQHSFRVPGEVLETTLGWPPSDGADVTILGSGEAGLIEVLDVPQHLRAVAPEGLAALSFLTDDYAAVKTKAQTHADDVTVLDTMVPGVELFFCTMGGVPMEFMGSYEADAAQAAAAGAET
jgi:catechol 2,3-dioxygenase-like lactoylglutathione lyase family enzyme